MKMLAFLKPIAIIGIIVILLVGSLPPILLMADHSDTPENKVSSLLSLHIQMKQTRPADSEQATLQLYGYDNQSSVETIPLGSERVYLHMAAPPTANQIDELSSLGVTIYPDSWLPPVNDFQTGFVLADMPVDKLEALTAKSYIVSMDTAEQMLTNQNDKARAAMNVDPIWNSGYTGAGVTVAVIDSGLDTSNPDFPTPLAAKDYSNYPSIDNTVSNTVTGHGTHVTASLLGRGVRGTLYKGVAPGAGLVFIKVGNDTTGAITSDAVTYAIRDAVDIYHVKIINLSIGTWSQYHDGSDQWCQAVDYATSQGATVFAAAGNYGSSGWHYSETVGAGGTTGDIPVTATSTSYLSANLVWYDGLGTQNNLILQYYDSNHNQLSPTTGSQSESVRGTESNQYYFSNPQNSGTYYLRVRNNSSAEQLFHIYYMGGSSNVTFSNPNNNYTIASPAEADCAMAVGAFVTRPNWTNYQGMSFAFSPQQYYGSIADFSSRGPRVDSEAPLKPNIVAPGSLIFSARDPIYTPGDSSIDPFVIDNDGLNLNGSGPADYIGMSGTSMASALAAGLGALVLSKNPEFTPTQLRHALEVASQPPMGISRPDNTWGWGWLLAKAAYYTNSWKSYSDESRRTLWTDFGSGTKLNIVYLWGNGDGNGPGCGFIYGRVYQVTYYDGANNKVASERVTSSWYNELLTQHTLGITEVAGTWHVIVSLPEFSPPEAYNVNWPFTIVTDSFNVENSLPGSPTVFTQTATTNFDTYATLNGDLTDMGSASSVQLSFDYGNDVSYGNTSSVQTRNSTGLFSVKISGLVPGSTYHFRAKADVGPGKVTHGQDMTFTTSSTSISGKIAFISNRDGNNEIYIMDADGQNQVRLTNNSVSDIFPVWAPDGSRIAFLSSTDTSGGNVFVMNTDGSNRTQLTNSSAFRLSWSPDGTKIAYEGGQHQIFVMNADGSNQLQITFDTYSGSYGPTWSSDGNQIAFCSLRDGDMYLNVYLMNPDGSNQRRITNNNMGHCYSPKCSPDGRKISFITQYGLYSIGINGQNLTKISDLVNLGDVTSWSPDSTRIAYDDSASRAIYVINADGTNPIRITYDNFGNAQPSWINSSWTTPILATSFPTNINSDRATLNGVLIEKGSASDVTVSFDWGTDTQYTKGNIEGVPGSLNGSGTFSAAVFGLSPGQTYHYRARASGGNGGSSVGEDMVFSTFATQLTGKIAFVSKRNGDSGIYLMNADGTNPIRITNTESDLHPSLSRDGSQITFDRAEQIWVMNNDGTNQIMLTNGMNPNWSPDGTQIAYEYGGEIYLMNSNGTNITNITNDSDSELWPTWSADGTKIAYCVYRPSEYPDIWVMNVDGTNKTRLISSPAWFPVWSPDGLKIAYVDGSHINVVNSDGTNNVNLLELDNSGHPAWSPDSSKIAFMSNGILIMNADGTNPVRLESDASDTWPSWSVCSLTTLAIMTNFATNVTSSTATLNGYLTPKENTNNVLMSFDWGTDTNYTGGNIQAVPATITSFSADNEPFTANLGGLTPGQTYHYRAKAVGDVTVYGDDISFTTNSAKLAFITTFQTTDAGSPSSIITLQMQYPTGTLIIANHNTVINLISDSTAGRFDTSAVGPFDGSISQVTIPTGGSQVSFYYKDNKAGSPVITASGIGVDSSAQQETISATEASQIRVETAANGGEFVVPSQHIPTGQSFTCYAISRDQYGNFVANIAGSWTLINKSGSISDGDIVSVGDGKSAVFTSHMAGTCNIHVSSGSLISVDSGMITAVAGDVNGDGQITMSDVTILERIILKIDPATPGADANLDGEVNMGDVTKIERIILRLDP